MHSSSRPSILPGADCRPRPPLDLPHGGTPENVSAENVAPPGLQDAGECRPAADDAAAAAASVDRQPAAHDQPAAFEAIVADHRAAVYGYLRSRVLEPSDAEDLCQEVFLRFYQGRDRFLRLQPEPGHGESQRQDNPALLRGWLIGIARNLLHEHVRRVKRRKEVAWTELCLQLDALVEQPTEQYDESMAHLPLCLQSLGQSARQALDMRYQAQMRLSEIGEKLRRSEGAIKLLMFRARQALKHCLDSKKRGTPP